MALPVSFLVPGSRLKHYSVVHYLRRKDFAKRRTQRELIIVVQRNFRKFLTLRHWPWFMLIQKTKPLIGMVNIEEEIRDAIQRRCAICLYGCSFVHRVAKCYLA